MKEYTIYEGYFEFWWQVHNNYNIKVDRCDDGDWRAVFSRIRMEFSVSADKYIFIVYLYGN